MVCVHRKQSLLQVGCTILFLCLLVENSVSCYKILLLHATPSSSHYLYLAKVGEHLAKAGHEVTQVLGHHNYLDRTPGYEKLFKSEYYNTTLDGAFHEMLARDFLPKSLRGDHRFGDTKVLADAFVEDCKSLLDNVALHDKLSSAHFDIALLDNFALCSVLLTAKLSIPFVIVSSNKPIPQVDAYYLALPSPVSYVPCLYSDLTDRMTFTGRITNLVHGIVGFYFYKVGLLGTYEELKQKYGIAPGVTMEELLGGAEMAIFAVDWAFEFPRPMMPNTVFIGGLLAGDASTLTPEWEEFVTSADNGIVVFSLGSEANLGSSTEKAEIIAAALARLPQKVVMRYDGEAPKSLGNNTKLADWIPQNDLLGHPQTKAFVTHGGINGIYEAIFHAVPMVAIPLFGDQHGNAARLARKGVGVVLKIRTLTSVELYTAVKTVIDEPSYKANALRLSEIHRDRPMPPGDETVFWIEHVIKFGGQHLRAEALNMNSVQYLLLDVWFFLLVAVLTAVVLLRNSVSLLITFCWKRTIEKKKNH